MLLIQSFLPVDRGRAAPMRSLDPSHACPCRARQRDLSEPGKLVSRAQMKSHDRFTTKAKATIVHVNAVSGYGNFHMKPNGVFYIVGNGNKVAIAETRAPSRCRDAIRADVGNKRELAPSLRSAQHVAQSPLRGHPQNGASPSLPLELDSRQCDPGRRGVVG